MQRTGIDSVVERSGVNVGPKTSACLLFRPSYRKAANPFTAPFLPFEQDEANPLFAKAGFGRRGAGFQFSNQQVASVERTG